MPYILTMPEPDKEYAEKLSGYTFKGWRAAGSHTLFQPGDKVKIQASGPSTDIPERGIAPRVFYAVYDTPTIPVTVYNYRNREECKPTIEDVSKYDYLDLNRNRACEFGLFLQSADDVGIVDGSLSNTVSLRKLIEPWPARDYVSNIPIDTLQGLKDLLGDYKNLRSHPLFNYSKTIEVSTKEEFIAAVTSKETDGFLRITLTDNITIQQSDNLSKQWLDGQAISIDLNSHALSFYVVGYDSALDSVLSGDCKNGRLEVCNGKLNGSFVNLKAIGLILKNVTGASSTISAKSNTVVLLNDCPALQFVRSEGYVKAINTKFVSPISVIGADSTGIFIDCSMGSQNHFGLQSGGLYIDGIEAVRSYYFENCTFNHTISSGAAAILYYGQYYFYNSQFTATEQYFNCYGASSSKLSYVVIDDLSQVTRFKDIGYMPIYLKDDIVVVEAANQET